MDFEKLLNKSAPDLEESRRSFNDIDGGVYTHDGLQLLKYNGTSQIYYVKPGCKVIRGLAFNRNTSIHTIVLPDSVEVICYKAFSDSNVSVVVLPDSVRKFGERVFWGCRNLVSIILPKYLLEIPEATFQSCSNLKDVRLPISLQTIGEFAFANCDELRNISLPNSLTYIHRGAFSDCPELEDLSFPTSLREIGSEAFAHCHSLKNVIIPEGVRVVDGSFFDCENLESISMPSTVVKMQFNGVAGCPKLKRFIVSPQNRNYKMLNGILYGDNMRTLERCYNNSIEMVDIPNGVTKIQASAFCDCTNLYYVRFPDSVISIGEQAFMLCPISNINLPSRLSYIGLQAFFKHSALEIKIPTSVQTIKDYAFEGRWLKKIIIPRGKMHFFKPMFSGWNQQAHLLVEE